MIHAGQLEVDRFPFDASADAIRSIMVDTASVARELLCLCSLTFKLPQHFAVFSGVSGRLSKTKLICELKTGLCTCVRSSQEGAEHRLTRNWTQHAADYVSRHMIPLTESDIKTCNAIKQVVHSIITDTTPQAITLAEVQDATKKDRELSKLIPLIQTGNRNACKADPDLEKYAQVSQELSYLEGVITRGHQIVIPKSLQERVINICHEGHLGIVETNSFYAQKCVVPRD